MGTNTHENLLHLGADLEAELVGRFRQQATERRFKKREILRQLISWWINQDVSVQQQIYHGAPQGKVFTIPSEEEIRRIISQTLAEAQAIPVKKKPARQAKKPKAG